MATDPNVLIAASKWNQIIPEGNRLSVALNLFISWLNNLGTEQYYWWAFVGGDSNARNLPENYRPFATHTLAMAAYGPSTPLMTYVLGTSRGLRDYCNHNKALWVPSGDKWYEENLYTTLWESLLPLNGSTQGVSGSDSLDCWNHMLSGGWVQGGYPEIAANFNPL